MFLVFHYLYFVLLIFIHVINYCFCISMTCLNNIMIHLHITSNVQIGPFLYSRTHKIRLLVMEIGTKECNLHHRLIRFPLRMVFSHRRLPFVCVHPIFMVVPLVHNFPAMGVLHHKCLGHQQ